MTFPGEEHASNSDEEADMVHRCHRRVLVTEDELSNECVILGQCLSPGQNAIARDTV